MRRGGRGGPGEGGEPLGGDGLGRVGGSAATVPPAPRSGRGPGGHPERRGEACSPESGCVRTGPAHPGAPGRGSCPGICAPAEEEGRGGSGRPGDRPGAGGRGACLLPALLFAVGQRLWVPSVLGGAGPSPTAVPPSSPILSLLGGALATASRGGSPPRTPSSGEHGDSVPLIPQTRKTRLRWGRRLRIPA